VEEFSLEVNQRASTRLRILGAFMARNGKMRACTWNELRRLSGLSKGALSKHLVVLFREGYVKGEVRVVNYRLVVFYMLAHPELGTSYCLREDDGVRVQLALSKDDKGRKVLVRARTGVLRRTGKSKGKRFRAT
jgi:DNA-binding transcriptional ArsR family regulator